MARRVIVLDADVNSDDLVLFRDYLKRQDMKSIYNKYQPDHDKKFTVEPSHRDNFGKLLETLEAGNRAVVFTHNKRHGNNSVENLAKQLQCRGYRVKYYHADTDPAEKQRDFSDVNNAFNDTNVVIHNHTMEAGVSIVDDRFTHLFVFSESIGSVEATKQALHRFRIISEIHYSSVSKSCPQLPLTRDDIIAVIESHERDLSETELLFRAPNLNEVNSSYGYAFISNVIDENNSRCYFTPRLVTLMKQSGYEITWTRPGEYELWLEKTKNSNKIFPHAVVNNSTVVDDFLKSSVAEIIAQSKSPDEPRTRYFKYDPEAKLDPYEKKLAYLNNVFQTDVNKLDTDTIEYLNKNASWLQRAQRVIVDKHNNGRTTTMTQFRSDKISPRQQLEIVRGVLNVLQLPDIVHDDLTVTTQPVDREKLLADIDMMINDQPQFDKYKLFIKHLNEIFPEFHGNKSTLTTKNIIEKIKLIYKGFGAELKSDDSKHTERSDYTLYYPEWPRSDFLDDVSWTNTTNTDNGFYGGDDVTVINDHTMMLKYHVWSINGWFSRYKNSEG